MNINISFLHFKAREDLKEHVKLHVNKLQRFDDRIFAAEVFLKIENKDSKFNEKVAEIILKTSNEDLFAFASSESFEKAINDTCDKLKNQISHKQKTSTKHV